MWIRSTVADGKGCSHTSAFDSASTAGSKTHRRQLLAERLHAPRWNTELKPCRSLELGSPAPSVILSAASCAAWGWGGPQPHVGKGGGSYVKLQRWKRAPNQAQKKNAYFHTLDFHLLGCRRRGGVRPWVLGTGAGLQGIGRLT